ncbi:MAG: RagB/SusD family nutrient uptake outer membrane protein [Flavihumibacter sp.]
MKRQQSMIYAGALALLLIGSGCSKNWVDTKPNGAPTTAYFWQSDDDLQKAIAATYVPMRYESTWGRDLFWVQNAGDDLVVGRTNANAANIKNFIPTGREGYMTGGWNDLYWIINTANQVIAGAPAAVNVTASLRERVLGEAYFMRAFAHFWLATIWGHKDLGVPFDGPENEGYGERMPPQLASVTDNYAQVISDLTKAADLLPLFETYGSADRGRAHKAAAWAYMVKTYAYWAEYDASKWSLVPDLCDKIKNEGNRALITGTGSAAANYKAVFCCQ